MLSFDILIVGAGIAGMSAALGVSEKSDVSVLVVDANPYTGGVLRQCLHSGFGTGVTGIEYADSFYDKFRKSGSELMLETTVVSIRADKTAVLSSRAGMFKVGFEKLILASGCTETVPASLGIGGSRPEGVYTAGYVQKTVNVLHGDVGNNIAVVGCGDLGMIMAGTLKSAGKNIVCMVEKNETHSGLAKNYRQYIETNGIKVDYGVTARKILGQEHVTGIELSDGRKLPCDTVIIAAGLKPDKSLIWGLENEPWIECCGNCKKIYDMVETVSRDSFETGRSCVCIHNKEI